MVWLGGTCHAVVQIKSLEDYEKFKSLQNKFGPVKEPFYGLNRSILARKSTYKKNRTESEVVKSDTLDDTDFLLFNVLKEKHVFF